MHVLDELRVPIVQAPMAGGASTPALAAAVSEAGGLGFVAAGYKSPQAMAGDIEATRSLTARPFGVNLFAPGDGPSDPAIVGRYVSRLGAEAARAGVALGPPTFDDDGYEDKLKRLLDVPVAVVSFTFGCPETSVVEELQSVGTSIWVSVTSAGEAEQAAAAGADALVVQGAEAGGHRGAFVDRDGRPDYGLLTLLQLVREAVDRPLVATGGIATGAAVAAVLAAGADAAQVGTAFMLCPEAGTSDPHRAALASTRRTGLTRAFTGRLARGITNRLQTEHSAHAPLAYPEVHHLTAPLRAHARQAGDDDLINLWAGQTHGLARPAPAAELVAELMAGAAAAAAELTERLVGSGT
jgi:nitronate monooxygenase